MDIQVRDLENYNDFNILVTGGSGQIGSDLKFRKENNNLKFFFPSSKELNLLEFDTIERYLDSNDFHLILNLAAFTDVDKSETHKEKANKINNLAVKKIAQEANSRNIYLIHSSTDYVFGESNSAPYISSDNKPGKLLRLYKKFSEEQALMNNNKANHKICFFLVNME